MPSQKKRQSATKRADALFSAHIRSRGYCEMAEMFPAVACNGNLQCAHVVSRRYRAVRWLDDNALCSCAAHHLYQTHHPLEFEAAYSEVRPRVVWNSLKRRALSEPPMDPHAVIERLKDIA